MAKTPPKNIVLIGAGIMSATLGVLLQQLIPDARISLFERLSKPAGESSDAWNNAGTGHAAFCELNYTPEKEDGSIEIRKAISIAEQFEVSKQFWSWLVENRILVQPSTFINKIPHCSFVQSKEEVAFLCKRFELLKNQALFEGMTYTEDHSVMHEWFPLIMEGRSATEILAATQMTIGTDVNFGALTQQMFGFLESTSAELWYEHEVIDIEREDEGPWKIEVKDLRENKEKSCFADFVFVGAGGGALKLLNKSGIDEIDGYGGFPVGGKWLKCVNPQIVNNHHAKVYGKAAIGAPPMSVPHLDSRIINGKKEMLFGPYAGFSTKFLKHGSYWDLAGSLDFDNMIPMIQVGIHNIPLTKYLVGQVRMSFDEKLEELKKFYPLANSYDWELVEAGQRVQVIKKNEEGEGVLEFGTELIHSKDGTIAGLLGASPGASTAVSIMLKMVEQCFPEQFVTHNWTSQLIKIIPGYKQELNKNAEILKSIRDRTSSTLEL